jgi:integrase
MRRHVLPHIGRLPVAAVTRGDVRLVLARLDDRPGTRVAAHAAISAVFSWAIREEVGGVAANPAARIRRPAVASRERVVGDDELRALWPDFDTTLRLILLTTARPGEVAALRAVDVADATWALPGSPAPGWPGTKTARPRAIPLSDLAAGIVADHLARRPRRRASEVLLARLWRSRGLEKITPHDLRRTGATIASQAGADRETLRRLLGHADNSTTSIYDRNTRVAEMRVAVDRIARHVERVVGDGAEDVVVRLR